MKKLINLTPYIGLIAIMLSHRGCINQYWLIPLAIFATWAAYDSIKDLINDIKKDRLEESTK